MSSILVLEGGAMRGIYTCGVIDCLLENNIYFDAVVGVSAGALFGCNYKSKQIGRVMKYTREYINHKDYLTFRSFFRTGNIMNKELFFDEILKNTAPFDFDTYKKNKTKFYCVVTNLDTGKAEYILLDDLSIKEQEDYIRASGSIPLVSKIININGNSYLDGGVSDSIPVKWARKNYNRVVVVTTRDIKYRKKKSNSILYKLFYSKYPKFINTYSNRYKDYNNTLDYIDRLSNDCTIFTIRPKNKIKVKRLEKDINKLNDLYELGYNDTINSLDELKKYLNN